MVGFWVGRLVGGLEGGRDGGGEGGLVFLFGDQGEELEEVGVSAIELPPFKTLLNLS